MTHPAAHFTTRYWALCTTTRARRTLAGWAESAPLGPAGASFDALVRDARYTEAATAAFLVRQAQGGDELAQLSMLMAALPRLVILVGRRGGRDDGPIGDLCATAMSLATTEILRPHLARCEDRIVFRIVSNVDWTMFRQPARRAVRATIAPAELAELDSGLGPVGLNGVASELHPGEHLLALLDLAARDGLDAGDVALIRRRFLEADPTPHTMSARTQRAHTQAAVARFVTWAKRAAARDLDDATDESARP
jgi:hypothetical protein